MGGCAVSLDLVLLLKHQLDRDLPTFATLDNYYQGRQPLNFLHPDIEQRLDRRIQPLVINWPRVIVGSIEERLDIEGFRSGDDAESDDRLWDWWQANNLDEQSQMGHADALIHGCSFVSVWGNDSRPDVPRIAVESASQMSVRFAPGTDTVTSALKVWTDDQNIPRTRSYAVLYQASHIEFWSLAGGIWKQTNAIPNPLGVVPVVPLVNRPRLMAPLGESELSDIIPIADAVNKLATDMMVSSEFHAMPRRWVTGMELPRQGQEDRFNAELKDRWINAFPGKPWIAGKDVEFGQFSESSLENFISGIRLLEGSLAAVAGLPPHYLGMSSDNPASADAIRSAESSLVKKALRKQRSFGGAWEQVMRLAAAVVEGGSPDAFDRMETIWTDPATPTPAQKADAAVKLTQGDNPIITNRQAQEDLGYSPEQIKRMAEERESATADAATASVRAQVAEAKRLQDEDGLTQQAAYAAVGLIVASQQMGSTPTL